MYLTIIPGTRIGYKLLDSGWGAKHRVGYHKLISSKREWNFVLLNTKHWIKISRTIFSTDSSFWPFCGKIFCDKNVSFHIWTNYSIQDLYCEYSSSQSDYRKFNIQCLVFNKVIYRCTKKYNFIINIIYKVNKISRFIISTYTDFSQRIYFFYVLNKVNVWLTKSWIICCWKRNMEQLFW